jgi:uncharacterized damage-inducible protein DinB
MLRRRPASILAFLIAAPICVVPLAHSVSAQEGTMESQMAAAVLPLPTSMREDAGIVRWTESGRLESVRASQNGYSCSMDEPGDDRFDVRCYADELWPALERRRELSERLESRGDVYDRIHRDLEEGTLSIPLTPTSGYRMLGPIDDFDSETLEAGPGIADWQSVHFPFETAEALGLTEAREGRQGDLMPFVMASGTWWSHVMIMHGPGGEHTDVLLSSLAGRIERAGERFVQLAEAIPEDLYDWRPMEGVRSFREVFIHVASDNWAPLSMGVPTPGDLDLENNPGSYEAYQAQRMSKTETLAELDRSFDYLLAALSETGDRLDETVVFLGNEWVVGEMWVALITHMHEHLGQTIAYARANGIVPPWSR